MDETEIDWIFETAFKASIRILGGSDDLRTRSMFYMRSLLLAEKFPSNDKTFQMKTVKYLEKKLDALGAEVMHRVEKVIHQVEGRLL